MSVPLTSTLLPWPSPLSTVVSHPPTPVYRSRAPVYLFVLPVPHPNHFPTPPWRQSGFEEGRGRGKIKTEGLGETKE